jgi:putative ABC transport system permease protein
MTWLRIFASRLAALFRKGRLEQELDEELRSHLEMLVKENMWKGMPPEEARYAARRSFGGVEQVKEDYREKRGLPMIETLVQDLRYGLRMLAKNPGFTTVAALTLALGIGVNTAIFSTVNGVLLRPFPFRQPDRLVSLWCTEFSRGIPQMGCAEPDLQEIARRNRSFESLAGYFWQDVNLIDGQPEQVQGVYVSPGLFRLLGVNTTLGRTFSEDESVFGKHRVVVLSHRLWERRFGGRTNVLGETFHLNSELVTVVGVMPADFEFPNDDAQLWMPISFAPKDPMGTRGNHFISALARLKPGINTTQARSDVQAIAHELERQFSENAGLGADASDYLAFVVGDVRLPLLIMLGAVAIVLLIACVNVANLLLSKASARHRELSVRAALGASRGRLVRQLLSESLVLSAMGAGLGLIVGGLLLNGIKALAPSGMPRLHGVEIDFGVLLFTGGLSVFSAVLFSLAPIFDLSRVNINESLKESGRSSTASAQTSRARSVLLVSEVMLSLVLAVGAGLLVRTLQRLYAVNPGFQAKNVLTMAVSLPPAKYPETQPAKAAFFYRDLTQRLKAIPGVRLAAAGTAVPLAGGVWGKYFTVDDHPAARLADVPLIQYRQITPDYFRALGIPLRSGRYFEEEDVADRPLVAIINEAAARRFLPDENPIGKRVFPNPPEQTIVDSLPSPDYRIPRLTIVGVVGDVKQRGLNLPSEPELFVPHLQGMAKDNETPSPSMGLIIKTASDPLNFADAARKVVVSLDPEQPVADVKTMEQRLNASLAERRFQLFLLGAFAALALLLAAIGIYGVMSYSVGQRTHEIGLRMALGASQRDVLNLIVRQGMVLSLVGIGLGIVVAFALTRFLTSLLYDVRPTDPATFVAVSLLLSVVSLVATYIPARRATKVDPMVALRCE